MRRAATLILLIGLAAQARAQAPYVLRSPDGRIEVKITAADRLRFGVTLDGEALVDGASLSLDVDRTVLGLAPKVRSAKTQRIDRVVEPPVARRAAKLAERCNELRLELEGQYAVVFRAYDDGVAYRFETTLPQARGQRLRRGGEPALRGRLERVLPEGRRLHVAQRAEVRATSR